MNPLKDLEEYKEAITSTTQGWQDIGIGFTEKESAQSFVSISRQLNTILYSVIQLRLEVSELRKKRTPEQADVTKLVEQLKNTHLSTAGATYQQQKGVIKVFKNPFDLLKQIK